MPGIVGIIGGGSPDLRRQELERMVECTLHESYYLSGRYHQDDLALSVGWTSHPGEFSAINPIWNESRSICLVFTGEEYCDREMRDRLRNHGHVFDGEDASYLVHLYEEDPQRFFERLNGSIAGVVIDLRNRQATLFNDRFGHRRIYLYQIGSTVYFASEAKALLKVLPQLRTIDPVGLAEFASCGCALQNRSLFKGVSLLPPASKWTFSVDGLQEKTQYFRADEWENQPRLEADEFYRKLKDTFSRVLPKYFRGERPIGIALTGGLDGRMIMAWSGKEPGSLPCYTFGGPYRDCTDVVFARRVAERCGQNHRLVPVGDRFLEDFATMAERAVFISDGAMDVTGSVELYANRLAREIAPIRMTGNYGSEILRGNVAFKPGTLNPLFFNADFLELRDRAEATYLQESEGNRLSFIAFKQVPWHHHSRLAVEQSQLTMRSPYLDNELVALAYQAPVGDSEAKRLALRLIAEGRSDLSDIPTDRGLLHRPKPVLGKLHNWYQEFTFRAEYAFDYGMPQWLARFHRHMGPIGLERAILGRHKFYHFRVWYRDQLAAYLRETLLDPRSRSRSYLAPGQLEKLVHAHTSGARNYTTELHQALSMELIHRLFIDG